MAVFTKVSKEDIENFIKNYSVGNLISFEGIEGVGKSTQISLLKEYLESKKYLVEIYREPGSTTTGEKIRDILLNNSSQLSDKAELLLMFAARAELINQKN